MPREEITTTVKAGRKHKKVDQKKEVAVKPFVSVVTPVYNGGKFLRECIESVLAQDYKNWEYVLVNNHSTDNSLEIMREYASRDDRIRIHNNKEFLPQMQNLNHSFWQISSKSKYCKVIHADDWMFPECLTKMVEVAEAYPSVGVVSSYRLDEKRVGLNGLPYHKRFNLGKEIARDHFLNESYYFGSPSSLLIRSELIRKRDKVYVESHQGTDTGAALDFLKESDFGFVHQVLTFTRRHEESVSNTDCKENYTWIHAKLYNNLHHAPHFLSDEEQQKVLEDDVNRYYIILARTLFQTKSTEEFNRLKRVLDDLNLEFRYRLFLKNVIREAFIQLFRGLGIGFKRV
jgi:glycosyltransferase involved in cell wall biosynthesis